MFVTAFLLWLVATQGLQLTAWLLVATVFVDLVAWSEISNAFEAWATGTTSDQEFWKDGEEDK